MSKKAYVTLKMKAVINVETLVNSYQTVRRSIAEGSKLLSYNISRLHAASKQGKHVRTSLTVADRVSENRTSDQKSVSSTRHSSYVRIFKTTTVSCQAHGTPFNPYNYDELLDPLKNTAETRVLSRQRIML